MAIYAIIDANGLIINRVNLQDGWDDPLPAWDDPLPAPNHWTPPEGTTVIAEPEGEAYGIGGTYIDDVYSEPPQPEPSPIPPKTTILSQDLLAEFIADDIALIQTAVNASPEMGLLWYALLAQRDEMHIDNSRFLSGWQALVSVLGQSRMDAIASNLDIEIEE